MRFTRDREVRRRQGAALASSHQGVTGKQKQRRDRKQGWAANFKFATQGPTSSSWATPPKCSTVSQNRTTRWGPRVQTLEPVEDILHPNHSSGLWAAEASRQEERISS